MNDDMRPLYSRRGLSTLAPGRHKNGTCLIAPRNGSKAGDIGIERVAGRAAFHLYENNVEQVVATDDVSTRCSCERVHDAP